MWIFVNMKHQVSRIEILDKFTALTFNETEWAHFVRWSSLNKRTKCKISCQFHFERLLLHVRRFGILGKLASFVPDAQSRTEADPIQHICQSIDWVVIEAAPTIESASWIKAAILQECRRFYVYSHKSEGWKTNQPRALLLSGQPA